MTFEEQLADILFPDVTRNPADLEVRYPVRSLSKNQWVTRIAPSPTGYLHIGVLFTALINYLMAKNSNGIFYCRIEDTDKKREVEGGAEDILKGFARYGIKINEGFTETGEIIGNYGPYRQSERVDIYHVYAKFLVAHGLAYPCFCTPEEREAARAYCEAHKMRTGYCGEMAKCRDLPAEEAIRRVRAGESYVLRLRSSGNEKNTFKFRDLIKGEITMPENDEDFVLLKANGVPTYHFAHAVDDHLMRTTHVIRGDEWLSSVPKHLELFRVLEFRAPQYAHVSPIMKEENGNKRKISKRKDPEAAVHFYAEEGYPAESVIEYLMTIVNSDFEDWHRQNPNLDPFSFPFRLKKMSVSGALFSFEKLNSVSRDFIALLDAANVTKRVKHWAKEYDGELYNCIQRDPAYAFGIFDIDRGNAKPRKDLAKWSEAKEYCRYFYDELHHTDMSDLPEHIAKEDAIAVLKAYRPVYQLSDDKQQWFGRIRELCEPLGFCPDVKAYKQDPGNYKGHVGDVSTVIRMAITGRRNSPDLYSIMRLLGDLSVTERIDEAIAWLEKA